MRARSTRTLSHQAKSEAMVHPERTPHHHIAKTWQAARPSLCWPEGCCTFAIQIRNGEWPRAESKVPKTRGEA